MAEFTKEQLIGWANLLIEETHTDISISRTDAHAESYRAQLALLEIALAALKAEPVAEIRAYYPLGIDGGKQKFIHPCGELPGFGAMLYAAQPAPVSVPDADLLHMAASAIDDLLSNKDRSGAGVWAGIPAKLRRAAMLNRQCVDHVDGVLPTIIQTAPALDSLPKNDEAPTTIKPVADLYEVTVPSGRSTTFTKDAAEAKDCSDMGWKVQEYVTLERCQAVMLQGAELVTTANKLPDDFICMLTGRAKYLREKGEIKSPELLERAASALQGESVNTSSIPNGWKLVPIDPTKDMLRAGQSVVGFWLNTVHCYSKMLAAAPAAPKQEVK